MYLVSAMSTFVALARGRLDWADALRDGSLSASGAPELVCRLATWFQRSPELSDAVVL